MKKTMRKVTMLSALLMVSFGMNVHAAGWEQGEGENAGKWRYKEIQSDQECFTGGWRWIDGNDDGVSECYYFNAEGWLVIDQITPDGYQVNSDGAWIENGIIRTKTDNVGPSGFPRQESDDEDFDDWAEKDEEDLSVYEDDLSPQVYGNIAFSTENLGVSEMALAAIINPQSNTVTAQMILEKKYWYEDGTDEYWLTDTQKGEVNNFMKQWKAEYITDDI